MGADTTDKLRACCADVALVHYAALSVHRLV
jgi:hypothetical protein